MSSAHARAYDTRHIMCCRYRAIATAPSLRSHPQSLQRSSTFQAESTPFYHRGAPSEAARPRSKTRRLFSKSSLSQLSNHNNKSGDEASEEDFVESADLPLLPQKFGSLQGMSHGGCTKARVDCRSGHVAVCFYRSTRCFPC